ncbi:NADP-dependent oxidoreductase domain-containing protein [Crucibulum laeve]|uniref:NADP-dependent oxidoreductase domain-containing protein n=1 Tax=Crucibulum laeve TaxID=68775 RepID=A0A5C3LSZ6_9AGAR|nr:NADP-dependent oxidoreductase domain-containing protein [Crucibulum laeve]
MADARKPMTYVRLGNSGLKVSKIILGCMSYGSPEWQSWVLEEEESIKHIKAAYDAGINTFDTANVYSNGLSEVILGKAIKQHNLPRDEIVVMTKVFWCLGNDMKTLFYPGQEPATADYVNKYGLSRKHIFDSVKKSLERLQLDYIDVLQCIIIISSPHPSLSNLTVPTQVIGSIRIHLLRKQYMHALHDIVKAGYVRYIGMSSCHAWQFHAMQNYAINNSLTPFISMQNHYNLAYREEEREMFPTLKHFGVGSIPWSPLARGLVTRPLSAQTKRGAVDRFSDNYTSSPGTDEIINRVEKIAKDKGVSMAQIALAWIMNREGVTAPIVGTTSLENLQDLVGTVNVKLTDEEMKSLEELYTTRSLLH